MINIVDKVEIPYDPSWGNIAISMSGGADSTILAYLLCDMIKQNDNSTAVHVINHVRMWQTRPWQEYDALRIYEVLCEMFPQIIFHRHVNFIPPDLEYGVSGPTIKDAYGRTVSGDNIAKRSFAEYVCKKFSVDCHYNGVTKNPPVQIRGAMTERELTKNESNTHLEFTTHMGIFVSHPLRFVDKSWVYRQYRDNGLLELFEQTRSCEGEFDGLDYKSYGPYQPVPVCGKCFWCVEREWSIKNA